MFLQFPEVLCYGIPKYSQLVRLQPEVVSMEWQSMDNNIDCGVFVMRHLETYMGNIFKWKSELRRERVDYFSYDFDNFFLYMYGNMTCSLYRTIRSCC